tara:strand:- start:1069 stop:1431 length:363 start_codon:yes stop_codon:yes gene_type:complete
MVSLVEQLSELERERDNINLKIKKLMLDIEFQNKDINAMEKLALAHAKELSKIFTHLRDKYNKRYKLHNGFLMTPSVNIRIIEPKGSPDGYDRYLDFDKSVNASLNENIYDNVNTIVNES